MINKGGAACCHVTHKVFGYSQDIHKYTLIVSGHNLYNSSTVEDRHDMRPGHTVFKRMLEAALTCVFFFSSGFSRVVEIL